MKCILIGIFAFALTAQGLCGITHASLITGHMTADDSFNFYISTDDSIQGTLVGSGTDWTLPYTLVGTLTPGVVNYLHISAVNGNDNPPPRAGFVGDFSLTDTAFAFANGTQYQLTNNLDWSVSATGFGLATSTPGVGSGYLTYTGGYDHAATAIWLATQENNQSAYFSTQINPTPEPATYILLSISLGAVGIARKQLIKRKQEQII